MVLTLRSLTNRFLRWGKKMLKPRTVEYYERLLNRFCRHRGNRPANRLKRHTLIAWGKTWHDFQAVQRLFNWAVEEAELLKVNPFRKLKRPRAGLRRRILDRATFLLLCRRSSRPFRRFLLALRETIARPQEIRLMRSDNVVWLEKPRGQAEALTAGQAVFLLDDFKGRERRKDPSEPRVIPITPRLGRMLARLSRGSDLTEGAVFLNSNGKPWTNNAVRCQMRRLRKRLKLGLDHRGERVVPYTVRHTVATWATAAGVRDRTLADLMGHVSTRTTARYQHLQVEHLQEAMRTVHKGRRKTGNATLLDRLKGHYDK